MTLVYGDQKIVDELNKLDFENKRLREENERLQQELDKTREVLNYFTKLKVGAMKVDGYGYDRCYVTSMQKKR